MATDRDPEMGAIVARIGMEGGMVAIMERIRRSLDGISDAFALPGSVFAAASEEFERFGRTASAASVPTTVRLTVPSDPVTGLSLHDAEIVQPPQSAYGWRLSPAPSYVQNGPNVTSDVGATHFSWASTEEPPTHWSPPPVQPQPAPVPLLSGRRAIELSGVPGPDGGRHGDLV